MDRRWQASTEKIGGRLEIAHHTTKPETNQAGIEYKSLFGCHICDCEEHWHVMYQPFKCENYPFWSTLPKNGVGGLGGNPGPLVHFERLPILLWV